LLHRGDLFSDIQLHVFLHGLWGIGLAAG
jgi:hypothetical protein